jgi:preprotein translocase subunit SecB
MKPPLVLKHHFYTEVHVTSDPSVLKEIKADLEFGYGFTSHVEVSQSVDNPLDYQVQLAIKSEGIDNKIKGYDIGLTVVGFVTADGEFPEDRRNDMVSVTGASLLYSAARDYLFSLTSRGPYPPVYLPTISFVPESISQEKDEDEKGKEA